MQKHHLCHKLALIICSWIISPICSHLFAEDWPEWRGNGRVGVWNETKILEKFPENGLEFQWRTPIRSGYAGPAVANGRVFVLDFRAIPATRTMEGIERILCLDEYTGRILWTYEWTTSYQMLMASYATGPRATPTVDDDRVYVVGATGMLFCFKTDTGKVIWKKSYVDDYGTSIPIWGVASAPFVDGDRLICIVGGKPNARVIAFDKMTGHEIWKALSSDWEMGYAQPIIFQAAGIDQLIIWQPKAVSSLNPLTGKVYWEYPFEVASGLTVATPVKNGSHLLLSQFSNGSILLEFDIQRPAVRMVWKGSSNSELPSKTDGLHSLITTPIIQGDYIYGVCSYGQLRCLDKKTGHRVWETFEMTEFARWAAAFIVKNGSRYFVNNDLGDLIIAQFTPEGYHEIDRTKLIDSTSSSVFGSRQAKRLVNWSHPAYANRHIVARNDREILRASLEKH